jgi:N-dimethylarginine dimethylaminohydrolase
VMGHVGDDARAWLEGNEFSVHVSPLTEFLKAGGSAKCLTLRLDSGLV